MSDKFIQLNNHEENIHGGSNRKILKNKNGPHHLVFPCAHSIRVIDCRNYMMYVFSKSFDGIFARIYDHNMNEIMRRTQPYSMFNELKNCIVINDRFYLFDNELQCITFDINIKSKSCKWDLNELFPDHINDEYLTFEILKDEKTKKILALGIDKYDNSSFICCHNPLKEDEIIKYDYKYSFSFKQKITAISFVVYDDYLCLFGDVNGKDYNKICIIDMKTENRQSILLETIKSDKSADFNASIVDDVANNKKYEIERIIESFADRLYPQEMIDLIYLFYGYYFEKKVNLIDTFCPTKPDCLSLGKLINTLHCQYKAD